MSHANTWDFRQYTDVYIQRGWQIMKKYDIKHIFTDKRALDYADLIAVRIEAMGNYYIHKARGTKYSTGDIISRDLLRIMLLQMNRPMILSDEYVDLNYIGGNKCDVLDCNYNAENKCNKQEVKIDHDGICTEMNLIESIRELKDYKKRCNL